MRVAALMLALCACASTPKRQVPDYDGRPDETTAGDVALWVPRVVLSPLYLTTEYVLRRPLSVLVPAVEQVQLPAPSAGPTQLETIDMALAPSFLVDASQLGTRLSFGAYFLAEGLFFEQHELRLRVAYGSFDWVEVDFENGIELAENHELALVLGFHRRDDAILDGGRYGVESLDVALQHTLQFSRTALHSALGFRHADFFDGACCDTVQLTPRVRAIYDSRDTRPYRESGVRLEGEVEYGHDLDGDAASYLRTSATTGGYLDVGHARTLGLRLHASLVEPTDGGRVNFSDLSQLGGQRPMRAFVDGELRGRSAFVATLDYRWPVWVWLDGQAFIETGNVFGSVFDGWSAGDLRLSFGIGVCAPLGERHPFELLLAAGTDTAANGLALTHWRVVFGTASGFW